MSSLQKFHRRTNGGVQLIWPAIAIGGGDETHGYWLGTAGDGVQKMIVSPQSTESPQAWGSYGTVRGTNSPTNGLANTDTLYAFGQAAHPAAYYCKTLTTGGYNTWYMPAIDELNTIWSNRLATPFAQVNVFSETTYRSSTEADANGAWSMAFFNGGYRRNFTKAHPGVRVRAIRRSAI
jgi:hypothetical protein